MHDGSDAPRTLECVPAFAEPPRATSAPLPLAPADGIDMAALVGRPHLFGRMRQLREGFLIEPFGIMTLQPEGRITGYGHPNEGSWKPYRFGPVAEERAFAFISGGNGFIPSSTWTQSIAGMPIGHFCDEPEHEHAAQRLCLVPYAPSQTSGDVVYLVASCLAFYERTVPRLLTELRAEGIEDARVKVVVNGAERDRNEVIGGIDHAFSTHNGWEWSALYEAPRRWRFDYAFLLHDTVLVLPGFRRSVEGFSRYLAWDHLPASPLARCLLGLYSHDFLTRLNPWLAQTHLISKHDGIVAEAGAELLLRARTALALTDPRGRARAAEWAEELDVYNTGQKRVRRRFPAVQIDKFLHTGSTDPKKL